MYKKGLPAYIIRIFANWWSKLFDVVVWRGATSEEFAVGFGLLQGSLLGGKFFNLMMDSVLCLLQKGHMGCHVDGVFAGAVAYADDLMLLSPSLVCLQTMLNLCEKEFDGFKI
jgi:hypothetical protein